LRKGKSNYLCPALEKRGQRKERRKKRYWKQELKYKEEFFEEIGKAMQRNIESLLIPKLNQS
jgi:hypothetical protein